MLWNILVLGFTALVWSFVNTLRLNLICTEGSYLKQKKNTKAVPTAKVFSSPL
ncbi:hypothetical protein PVAP13_6NG115403 [Panicum virgatum]|uniref:Uncharacterized protein n=1 Tax=Panicum virgatum TaxID=38727 RepID=A0A8T0R0H0_PANVG|nr:hypothetical protein PVAP13_6NG115403 [Panicum virgatum]